MNRAFLVTWVTHNSRVSDRMLDLKIETGTPIILNLKEEIEITKYIYEVVLEDHLKVLSYVICADHVHIILICPERKLSSIVQKLKSVSARRFNIAHGLSVSVNKGACSLVQEGGGKKKHGKAQNHLWAQKYNRSYLDSKDKYQNAIWYVKKNREKHCLSYSKKLAKLASKMEAFVSDNYRSI